MASSNRHFKSQDDYKKNKELEEGRKAGTVPPQVDEEGHDINPHIPEYVKQSPWYLDLSYPSLKHQKTALFNRSRKLDDMNVWYPRGEFSSTATTKYRPGACTNCGAMTHSAKSCTDRPRKIGARWSGKAFMPDEVVHHFDMDYAAKRDRWNGYDPEQYKEVIEFYDKIESARREHKAAEEAKKYQQLASKSKSSDPESKSGEAAPDASNSTEDGAPSFNGDALQDEFKADDMQDNVGQFAKIDAKSHRSVRDLRIREDTAKYLLNLDEDSPFYDPKSRSMRANPYPNASPDEALFKGDNWNRFTGDTRTFYDMQKFSWEAGDRGEEGVHLQATPSQAAIHFEMHKREKVSQNLKNKSAILEEYGGAEYLSTPASELLLSQSEAYIEYTPDGLPKHQDTRATVKSKYEENVFYQNHTTVFGSWWENGEWGYKCCKQTLKNSYCTASKKKSGKATDLSTLVH